MIREATLLQAFARKFQIHWNKKLGMDWQLFTDAVPEMNPLHAYLTAPTNWRKEKRNCNKPKSTAIRLWIALWKVCMCCVVIGFYYGKFSTLVANIQISKDFPLNITG